MMSHDDELTGVVCILNSKPLTTPSSDPRNSDPLTPSQVLTLKSRVIIPSPDDFQKTDVCLPRRWKCVQYLSNVFWLRWRKEFVQNLHQREKWNRPRRNYVKGDLVLIIDDRLPRNHWNMARIVEARPEAVKVTTVATTREPEEP